jgi:hypothetical protein
MSRLEERSLAFPAPQKNWAGVTHGAVAAAQQASRAWNIIVRPYAVGMTGLD